MLIGLFSIFILLCKLYDNVLHSFLLEKTHFYSNENLLFLQIGFLHCSRNVLNMILENKNLFSIFRLNRFLFIGGIKSKF